ncbi:CHT1 [Symbiodinium sp. CCMP2592]|nr:CHT1 [Symbiodinium sp. CCMP2592]
MPQRKDVSRCIDAALKACNGEAKKSQILRVALAHSWDRCVESFGPDAKKAVTIRLAYLENRKSLHAFAPEKVTKEVTTKLQQRLEKLAGPDLANIKARVSMTSQPRRPDVQSLGGWKADDWARQLKELLGARLDFSARPLKLATGCSGAEAPHFALRMLVGREGFEQLFGSDINETPRRFMLKNCHGQKHLFEDVKHVMDGRGSCARHGGFCPVPKEDVDIFIGGFPCTPYSFCNPKRFKRNCFTEPAAAPFFEMRKFIAARRPRLVILENVRGLLAPNPETKDTPMDFILRGKNPEDPEHCYQGTEPGAQWGLSLIEGYGLHWDLLYSCDWGLPQRRPRVYIVMVREDAGGQKAADRIFEVLHACAGHLPCGSCNDFLYPEGHLRLNKAMQLAKGGSDSERKPCTPFTEALFKATRQEHGLDPSERPYTNRRPRGWYPEATEKMVQQLDIIHALAEKRALDFKFLLADLSQQVSRGCWRDDGYVPTLTTAGSLYSFHHHRPILGEECMRLNGFPVEDLDLEGFTDNELKFLAGNAMSVSVVGAVLLAGLVSVSWGEKRSAAATKELPAARDIGPRYRKKEAGDKEVVLASLALDDDGSETELDSSESGTSARAAMLFLMAKELQAAKSEKGGGSSGTKRKRSTGQEEDEDPQSWEGRHKALRKKTKADSQVCSWVLEAAKLLANMSVEEQKASSQSLQLFVTHCLLLLQRASQEDLLRLDQGQQPLAQATELLIERLRFAEAKPVWGSLWAGKLRLAISQKEFDDRQCILESWLPAAAKLRGKELSGQRFQLLDALLSRSPPLRHLALLLERLLTRWCKEEMLNDELNAILDAFEALKEAWVRCLPENWQAICRASASCSQIASTCRAQRKPQTAKELTAIAIAIQSQCFAAKAAQVLHSSTRAGDRQALLAWCTELGKLRWGKVAFPEFFNQAAWRLWQRLPQQETEMFPVQVPDADGFAKDLSDVRASASPQLAIQADAFLRHFHPALATHVHLMEWRMSGTSDSVAAKRCVDSEKPLFDLIKRSLTQLCLQAGATELGVWCEHFDRILHCLRWVAVYVNTDRTAFLEQAIGWRAHMRPEVPEEPMVQEPEPTISVEEDEMGDPAMSRNPAAVEVEELDVEEELDDSPEESQLQGEEGQVTQGFQELQGAAGEGSQVEEETEPESPQEPCHSPATREAISEFLTGFDKGRGKFRQEYLEKVLRHYSSLDELQRLVDNTKEKLKKLPDDFWEKMGLGAESPKETQKRTAHQLVFLRNLQNLPPPHCEEP